MLTNADDNFDERDAAASQPAAREQEGDMSTEGKTDAGAHPRAMGDAAVVATDGITKAFGAFAAIDPEALAPAVSDAGTIDLLARSMGDAAAVDTDGIARALSAFAAIATSVNVSSPPGELVSEDSLDDVSGDEVHSSKPGQEISEAPDAICTLLGALETQGFSPELHQRGTNGEFEITFELQAGRSTRLVWLDEAAAEALDGVDVSEWRSLQRFDGIWSANHGVIEIILRGERFGPGPTFVLRRLSGEAEGSDEDSLEVVNADTGAELSVGPGSEIAAALLGGRLSRRRRILTARVVGVAVSTSDEADGIAERVADALSVDLDMTLGVALVPQRLERREAVRSRSLRRGGAFNFPRNSYPHAAVLLYQAGRERVTAPLIRYWSFYQVLEFFFPKFSQAEALGQLSRLLRSPSFDAHRDEDVLGAVRLATQAGRGFGTEEDQLITTLQAITTPPEIVDFAEQLGLAEHLQDRKSELTVRAVDLGRPDDLLTQLGQRIYDIRCRIVHSKSSSQRESGPGLLPGTHHDDLVRVELPLMEFLAQQALVESAEPLALPARRGMAD